MGSDFVGSCGRQVFRNYLKELCAGSQGSLYCAVKEEGRVIGFIAGVVDRRRFNYHWIWRNLLWLVPLIMVKFFSSYYVRRLILTRLRAKFRDPEKGVLPDNTTDISSRDQGQAMSMWLMVDETFRGEKDVASLLITSLEKDLKGRGVARVYGSIDRTNLASVFIHLKNGWRIMHKDDDCYLAVKDL